MTPNLQLMIKAKESLKGNWGTAAITTLVFTLLISATNIIPGLGPILFSGPLMMGYVLFIISIKHNKEYARVERLFDGFKDFSRTLTAYLLVSIYVFLWSLLFIIPGIIMSYAYQMTFFILADDKDISASEAIKKSKKMMMGNKWKLFCLDIRFFGWYLLVVITFGIAAFWVIPYVRLAQFNFYEDLKANMNCNMNMNRQYEPGVNSNAPVDESYRRDDNQDFSPIATETNENISDENIPGVGVEESDVE